MSDSRVRPGNPDRVWNDPPMFNYTGSPSGGQPRRALNKRVAFPMSSNSTAPGHAVLKPSAGPPILNPVLPADIQGPPMAPQQAPVPIGLRDTPLGNQAPPSTQIQLLPPSTDVSMPQTVPVLVPLLVPSTQPLLVDSEKVVEPVPSSLDNERLEDLIARLSVTAESDLLKMTVKKLNEVLEGYSSILTKKVYEDITRKLEILQEKWPSLSETVKVRVVQLALALSSGETDKASHLQLALVVDHIAEVNQWVMGVKRLIQQQQLANKEKEIISENRMAALGEEDSSNQSDPHDTEKDEANNQSDVNQSGNSDNQSGTIDIQSDIADNQSQAGSDPVDISDSSKLDCVGNQTELKSCQNFDHTNNESITEQSNVENSEEGTNTSNQTEEASNVDNAS
ncbi:SRA1-like protein [Mya arenaria]|uniref:SRA1-like protein n=1 Tax=Mya arenaria TaxID=6604 RepID=A0ABY7DKH2_MYAAR|nr:steroid receptor RNA activator 1-like [Mya arenaria]WAQ98182.1 SRA1-like protein [Mya arenaria]